MGAVHITVEKSFLRDDEEADIAMSPIRSQTVIEKGSMETTITSKTKTSGEFTVR